jgi:hypothetical protein
MIRTKVIFYLENYVLNLPLIIGLSHKKNNNTENKKLDRITPFILRFKGIVKFNSHLIAFSEMHLKL